MFTSRVPVKGIAAVTAAVVIGIGMFELAVRLWLGPPAVLLLSPAARDRQTDFDITYVLDRQGRRAGCPPPAAPRRRVAVIGDSFAFGVGVGQREHVAARLGCRMSGTEIVNLGSSAQDFLYYEMAVHSLVPADASEIVFLLYENDLPPADWSSRWWRMKRTLYRSSHAGLALRKAKQALIGRLHRSEIDAILVDGRPNNVKVVALTNPTYFETIAHPPPARLEVFDAALGRLVGDARAAAPGARVFVAMAPHASTLSQQHRDFFRSLADVPLPPLGPSVVYHRAQAACAALHGCLFIDLYEPLSRALGPVYFPHDFHWNACGHAVVADAVLAALTSLERPLSTPRD